MSVTFSYDNQISVVVETDTKTVYAYYLTEGEFKGDLWLLNLSATNNARWNTPASLPFLNKDEYIDQNLHDEVRADFDINNIFVKWEKRPGSITPTAWIYYNDLLVGRIDEGDKPGYSTLVVKDGPLAKCYFPSIV